MPEKRNGHKTITKLADLRPDSKNANRGTQYGRGLLDKSLRKYGAGRSILIDKNGRIIGGNKTTEAAVDIGMDDVIVVQTDGTKLVAVQRMDLDLDEPAARELAYADNRTAQVDLDWNPDQLLADVNAGIDLAGLFGKDDLDAILRDAAGYNTPADDPGADDSRAAELQAKWGTALGQLWQIGNHRLLCGDCTKADDVARVMGGEKAELSFTSPPYSDIREYTQDGDLSPEHLATFIGAAVDCVDMFAVNLGLKREDGAIDCYWDKYIDAATKAGLRVLAWNVWSRHGFGGSIGNMTAMFPIEHEWVFVFGRQPKALNQTVANKHGGKSVTATVRGADGRMSAPQAYEVRSYGHLGSVYVSDVARGEKDHPAMFPVEFPSAYIDACTGTDGIVYDPFSGSGTTIVACERLGRKCRAIEISPAYVAVTLERLSGMGLTPELVA